MEGGREGGRVYKFIVWVSREKLGSHHFMQQNVPILSHFYVASTRHQPIREGGREGGERMWKGREGGREGRECGRGGREGREGREGVGGGGRGREGGEGREGRGGREGMERYAYTLIDYS